MIQLAFFCINVLLRELIFHRIFEYNRRLMMLLTFSNSKEQLKFQNKHIHYRHSMKQKYSRSILKMLLVILLLVPSIEKQAVYGQNEIINGNFSSPIVLNRTQSFDLMIEGWHCRKQCQIKNCSLGRAYFLPLHSVDSNCNGQVIDLNSNVFNQLIYQQVNLKAGIYIFQFSYYYPVDNANKKSIEVTINQEPIFQFRPVLAAKFQGQLFLKQIQTMDGINNITFQNFGFNDGKGFKLNNISLRRKINDLLEGFMELFFEKAEKISMFPGARIAVRSLFSFMVNFDRLELYIYHNRTYSYHSELFLLSVNSLLGAKSKIVQTLIDKINPSFNNGEQNAIDNFNYKGKYIKYPSFSDQYQISPYFKNLNQSLVYFIPFILLSFIVFNTLFQIFYSQPISLFFRKFSLWGIVFIMIFDGNIQQITFFTFSQFTYFFSRNNYHKILNFSILIIFLIILIIVFGILLWFKFHYGKRSRYLFDEESSNNLVIASTMFDRGIICILFGLFHQILLNFPNLQIGVLVFLEFIWIFKKIIVLFMNISRQKIPIALSIICGLFRITVQITWIVYEKYPHKRIFINQVLDEYLILGMFCVSMIEILIGSMIAICQGGRIIFWNRDSKITDINSLNKDNESPNFDARGKKYKAVEITTTNQSINQRGKYKKLRRRYPFMYKVIYIARQGK